jgi:hypothetical protein
MADGRTRPTPQSAATDDPATRLRHLLRERAASKEALDGLLVECALSETERAVVQRVATRARGSTVADLANDLDRNVITVRSALRSATNKLEGREGRHHVKKKYFALKDSELANEVRKAGASTRGSLHRSNPALAAVARARGVLDALLPPPVPTSLARLRKCVQDLLRSRSLAELCVPLTAVECGVIEQRVLRDAPRGFEYFRAAYGIATSSELHAIERTLHAKLTRRPYKGRVLDELRRVVEKLGSEVTQALPLSLTPHQTQVLRERVIATEPVTLAALALRWNVSRERARQIEELLLVRMSELARTHARAGSRAASMQLFDAAVGHVRALRTLRGLIAGLSAEERKAFEDTLGPLERSVFERRAAADAPESLATLAQSTKRSVAALTNTENRLLERLGQLATSEARGRTRQPALAGAMHRRALGEVRARLNALGPDARAEFARGLPTVERMLFDRRAMAVAPARLDVLATELARSVPALTLAEKRLLARLIEFARAANPGGH